MTFPGLELVVASSAADVIGLIAAAVRDPDPIIFHEHKSLYATKGEVPNGKIVDKLGTARSFGPTPRLSSDAELTDVPSLPRPFWALCPKRHGSSLSKSLRPGRRVPTRSSGISLDRSSA
jgi:hypothetical protein